MSAMDDQIKGALAGRKLGSLKVIADAQDVVAMEGNIGCKVPFADALAKALDALLSGAESNETAGQSLASVVRDVPGNFNLKDAPPQADVSGTIQKMLTDDKNAAVVLLTPTTLAQEKWRFPPEFGESADDNWVFRVDLPASFPGLIWAIVDVTGKTPAYSYTFD